MDELPALARGRRISQSEHSYSSALPERPVRTRPPFSSRGAVLMSIQNTAPSRPSALHLARRSREFIRGYRTQVLGIVTLALVLAIVGAADPLVMKYLFDALTERRVDVLPYAVLALLGVEA